MIKIADIGMDSINIEIESSSDKATKGIESLEKSLNGLNTKLSNVQNNATKYAKSMQSIGGIFKNFKLPKLPNFSEMFKLKFKKQENPLKNIELNNNKNDNGDDNKGKKTKKEASEIKKTIEELRGVFSATTREVRSMLKYLGKVVLMKSGLKALNTIFGGIGSKISVLSSNFKTLAKNLSKYSLALFGIRSAFYAVRNTSNEFLSSQDAVAKQLSVNISYLKFTIGSMFAPVIEYITNLIYKLLQAIQALVYYFAKINIFAGKTASNYANMANSASKARKETQKQLQAFDELNNINFDKDNGAGSGAGNITPSFDLSGIREDLLPKFDDIENLFKDLATKINKALGSINWDSIIDKTKTTTKKIADALNSFTKELDFNLIGYTIGQALNTVTENLNTFFDTYDFNTLGKKLGDGINSLANTINWESLGKSLTNGFKAAIDVLYNLVTTIKWSELGEKVGTAIKAAFANIDWKKVGQTIYEGAKGILDFLIKVVDTMNVDQIAKDISDMLGEINFGELFTKALTLAAKTIGGLGKILWEAIFSGDGDLAKILFLIVDAIAIKKMLGLLFSTLGTNLKNSLVESMSKAKDTGSSLTKTLNDTSKATTTLKTGFNNLMTSIGKAAQTMAVLGGLRLVIDGLTNLLKTFGETGLSVGESLGFLGGTVGIIVAAFAAMMGIMKGLEPSWQSIAGAAVILTGFALVINQVATLLQVFANSGLQVNDVIGLMLAIFVPIVALMGAIALLGPEMSAGLLPFSIVVAGISAILLVMAATLPTILDAAGNFISTIGPTMIEIIKAVTDGISKIIEFLGKTLPPIIEALGKTFETIFNGISKIAETVGKAIKTICEGVAKVLDSIFNGIGKVFETVFNGISDVAKSVGEIITKVFEGVSKVIETIGNTVEKILEAIGKLIQTIADTILRFVREVGPAVENSVNSILSAVTRLINFTISAIEYLVNTVVIGGVNAIIKAINSISQYVGINIPEVPKISIPRFSGYEDGGYPTRGDFFYANENGVPEMIGRIGNKTAVANNDQITKAIADATYTAFVQALGENSGNDSQPLNIYIGNDKVYKGYTKQQSQMSNQYGVVI